MARAFRIFAAVIALIGFAWSQGHAQIPLTGAGRGAPTSGGFTPSCSQSSTFLAAATGVTLTADKTNYDTLICGLVSDGVWNFDVFYIWAAPSAVNAALINLANPGTFNGTTNGTVNFTAYQGYTGDSSTFYIDSGFNPSTATTPNFVQNSANLGVYVLSNRATGTSFWQIGSIPGSLGNFVAVYNGGNLAISVNSATQIGGASSSSAQGSWNATRVSAIREDVFLNSTETPINGTADTSQAPGNANIIFFSFQNGFGHIPDQMAAGWIGKGLSNVDSCKVNNRINTYMGSLSVPKNVYSNSAC